MNDTFMLIISIPVIRSLINDPQLLDMVLVKTVELHLFVLIDSFKIILLVLFAQCDVVSLDLLLKHLLHSPPPVKVNIEPACKINVLFDG